jgi:hypothetical protein
MATSVVSGGKSNEYYILANHKHCSGLPFQPLVCVCVCVYIYTVVVCIFLIRKLKDIGFSHPSLNHHGY